MDGLDSINGVVLVEDWVPKGHGQQSWLAIYSGNLQFPNSVLEEMTSRYEAKLSHLDEKRP